MYRGRQWSFLKGSRRLQQSFHCKTLWAFLASFITNQCTHYALNVSLANQDTHWRHLNIASFSNNQWLDCGSGGVVSGDFEDDHKKMNSPKTCSLFVHNLQANRGIAIGSCVPASCYIPTVPPPPPEATRLSKCLFFFHCTDICCTVYNGTACDLN